MSTNQGNISCSTAASTSMMSTTAGIKVTISTVETILKDNKVDKLIQLENVIQYIEQIKNKPVEEYMKEVRSLMSQLMLRFRGDKDYFLPWVRFLDIAYVHKMHKPLGEEEEAFKRGVEEIMTEILLRDLKIKSIDWRIARKILSLNGHFSLPDSDLKKIEEGILGALKAEIRIAFDHLAWQEESLFVASAKTALISLQECFDNPNDQDQSQKDLLEAVRCGRFDKEKFNLMNSIIMGEDGGLYMLLNRMNQQQQDALVADQIVTRDYLKDKIKPNAKDEDASKDEKVVLGTGGFGTVKFAMSLLRSRSLPAEIVCLKKTRNFQNLSGDYAQTPLKQVTESTVGDYFTNDRAQAIYSPSVLDMALITSKNVIKEDMKDHRKGYLMMEVVPQNTATRIFADERYQKWEYQKPYLLDVFENTQKLLESDIAMIDLKPDNTLYDIDTRKATIIDLGGSIKVASSKDLFTFDLTKYSFQSTPAFRAPELGNSQGVVNMYKSLAYTCGKVIEAITHKSDYDQKAISQLINKLTTAEPVARISIAEAISEIKGMGDDSYRKNIIFSHYISKVKDRLENKKSAISINEDIDKTRELLITLNSTSLDPSKYKDLKTEDLLKKIDDFLVSGNPKQVMAIFGVAGSGKSIALQLKFIQAVYAWQPGKPLPIYFNLANGLELDQIVRTLNTELGTNLNFECLNGQHFYIDSFDEGLGIEHKRETLVKEYFRQLGSPKMLITCRTDYLLNTSHNWFSPESKELEVWYVTPINYNGHQDLSNIVEKYVGYFKQHTSAQQHTTQDYLNRLKELQLTDLIDTGFMFFLVMEVLFQLQDRKEGRVNKVDIYETYTSYYQNAQIAKLKTQDQKKRLVDMILSSETNAQLDLCSFTTELGKHLACQMHLMDQARLSESDLEKLFAELGYDSSILLKHQSIIHMLRLLPLKIVTTQSGKRFLSNQEVKIGFIHETIKNYYLLEVIKSEIEREGKSLILASKSIVHDSELVRLIVLAMGDDPKLNNSFFEAIENSKHDKSLASITHASNSISLLVAAKHSFLRYDLRKISVKGANIVNGTFINAQLDNADLSGVDMSNVNLTGASLNGADMRGVNFSIFPDLVGHYDFVESISFSPDGKFLASGSSDETIKIWNTSTGECLNTLKGHNNYIYSVCYSPNGEFLASGSWDKTIKIWNPSTGECVLTLNGHDSEIQTVSFCPESRFLASGSRDTTVKIWDSRTGECLHTLKGHTDHIHSVSFSPDGNFLASGSRDNTIRIWNPSTGECLHTLNGHNDYISAISFSHDGKFLASGSNDETIKIWDLSINQCLHTLNGHTDSVNNVSFSPDSKFLASGSCDNTIKIWNPSMGECLQTLKGHANSVRSVSFSPDAKFLASGSWDKTIKMWSTSAGECLQTLNGHNSFVKSVSFSPDGKFLASSSSDKAIKIWKPSTGECFHTLNGHNSSVRSVSFCPESRFLASGSKDSTVKIWDSSTGECLHTFKGSSCIKSVIFSPDGKFLASGEEDKKITIWNPSTKECLHTLNAHATVVNCVSFSSDSRFLASGSDDRTVRIWNPTTGERLRTFQGHSKEVYCVSFSPDCNFVASGSRDKIIMIWNLNTGKRQNKLDGHTGGICSVSYSPDGKFLASGSADSTIKIWNPSSRECLHTLIEPNSWIRSVSFSPDGKFLASASGYNSVKIFEFEAKTNAWPLKQNISATPSPLLTEGATLTETTISHNNRLILTQKGADTTSSVIDNTINHYTDTSLESNRTANQLSQAFLVKFIVHQSSQNSKLVTFSIHSDEIHLNTHQQKQDSKLDAPSEKLPNHISSENLRSSKCCQIFAITQIVYHNPLLNSTALFAKMSQILGPIQALKMSNM